jgi:thioredoxin-like negative regulator of GroEL
LGYVLFEMATQILLSALLALVSFQTRETSSNSISGHVSNDEHVPLADIRVELLDQLDSVIRTVKTDGSGLFVFRKLSDGTFQVRVQTSGTNYVSQTKRVDLARPHGFGAAFEELDFILITDRKTSSTAKPGVVFVQEVPEPARKQYQKGTELLEKSDKRQEAFVALKSAIDIFPQYFDALEMLGTEQVKDSQYEAAIPLLTKALEVNSRAYASCFALGVAQYNLKQFQPAIESFKRAVLLNEKSINANLWLGIALRQTNRPEEAEAYLKRADVLADSKLPDAHWQLALLYNQLKRFKEAADELEKFLKVQPDARDAELIKKLIQRLREQSRR